MIGTWASNLFKKTSGSPAIAAPDNSVNKGVSHRQWALFAMLQVFNLYQLLNHAMWRDELQTWSLVRESRSLLDVFQNMRYDGFPPLWYIALWGISCISVSPLAMQLFHFTCSFAAQFLVMKRAPFSGTMKLAIIAGYYFSFEYCIISRAYVLGVLFIFLFCAFHAWLEKQPAVRGTLLGLLANTSVYGAILSLALVANDLRSTLKISDDRGNHYRRGSAAYLVIYGLFLLAAIACMLPPADATYAAGLIFYPDLTKNIYALSRNLISLAPVPLPRVDFWNSLLAHDTDAATAIPVSLAVASIVWLSLRSTPRYLGTFITGFTGIWLFTIVKFFGTLRHAGAAMVLYIACLWLTAEDNKNRGAVISKGAALAAWCLLGANLVAYGMASYYHLKYDFSGSREMAGIIQLSVPDTTPIIGDIDYAASSVAGYLERPLYYVTNHQAQTFIRWNSERNRTVEPGDLMKFANILAAEKRTPVLFLLNYPLESGMARFVARTAGNTIVKDEFFYLYEYVR